MSSSQRQAHARVRAFRLACSVAARRLLAACMLAAVAALSAGCTPSRDQKTESVTVAAAPGLIRASIIVASEKRFFAEQGLEVSIKTTASGRDVVDMVARGDADAGLCASVPFVMGVLDNKDIRILARVYRSRRYISIVARKDRGIAHPADFAGKRIGLEPGATPDYFTDLYLGMQGISPDRYTRVPLSVNQFETALQNGEVDAVAVQHPYSSRLIAGLGPKAIEFNDPAIYQLRVDLIARPEFSELRPDAARRFMLALRNALTYMRNHPEETKLLVLGATTEDRAIESRMWEGSDFTLTLEQSVLSAIEDEARWALARKGAAHARLPNLLDFIDARPLRSAEPEAVTILLP